MTMILILKMNIAELDWSFVNVFLKNGYEINDYYYHYVVVLYIVIYFWSFVDKGNLERVADRRRSIRLPQVCASHDTWQRR